MITVTVDYVIKKEHAARFREAVQVQARNSLTREPDCHHFDVSVDPSDPGRFFLYECYTDAKAFEAHRQTEHYAGYIAKVGDWVDQKTVRTWNRLDGTEG